MVQKLAFDLGARLVLKGFPARASYHLCLLFLSVLCTINYVDVLHGAYLMMVFVVGSLFSVLPTFSPRQVGLDATRRLYHQMFVLNAAGLSLSTPEISGRLPETAEC